MLAVSHLSVQSYIMSILPNRNGRRERDPNSSELFLFLHINGTFAEMKQMQKNLMSIKVPKLFVNAEPGAILLGAQREACRAWPNQHEVTVGGRHFIQEDSPAEIGHAVADFVGRVQGPSSSD